MAEGQAVLQVIKGSCELLSGALTPLSFTPGFHCGRGAGLRDPQLPPEQFCFPLPHTPGVWVGFCLNIEIHSSKRFRNPWGWSNHLGVRFLNC